MTQEDNQQNMGGQKALIPYIEPADAGEWGRDWSAPVDDGWGCIHGADSSAHPFKTEGSWEFAQRTLSSYCVLLSHYSCIRESETSGSEVRVSGVNLKDIPRIGSMPSHPSFGGAVGQAGGHASDKGGCHKVHATSCRPHLEHGSKQTEAVQREG